MINSAGRNRVVDYTYLPLNVVCVKYGTKYGADYVNKLYWGVKENLSLEHTFTCFTEDGSGLDPQIRVQPLHNTWKGWWSKVHIFDKSVYPEANSKWVLYIDLDMIITGPLDDLVQTIGSKCLSFATLTTEEIFCENVDNGYNSSVMLFNADLCGHLYEILSDYYPYIMQYLMRFDHYLEMLVQNAQIVQKMVPGQLIDYSYCFREHKMKDLPPDCRIVAFPRNPKPHEIPDEWAKKHWVYQG